MKSIGNRVLFLLLSFSLISCASTKEKPKLNPNPKYFLTIKGYISPELKDKIFLSFVQTYIANSDKCLKTANVLAGVKGSPNISETYDVTTDKSGNYKIEIPIDKYLPGYCDWQPLTLGYTLDKENEKLFPQGFGFITYDNEEFQQYKNYNPKIVEFICKEMPKSCQIKTAPNTYEYFFIKSNQSYTQILNVKHQTNGGK